jgi:RHS repeat-associated protein
MKLLISVRAAAAVLILLFALRLAAACDHPPLLEVNMVPHDEDGYSHAWITTQYVTQMQIYNDGRPWSAVPFAPSDAPNYQTWAHRIERWCMAGPEELKITAKGSSGCDDVVFQTMIDPADTTPELYTEITPASNYTHVNIVWEWKGTHGTIKGTFFPGDGGAPEVRIHETTGEGGGEPAGRSTGSARPGMFLFEGRSCDGTVATVEAVTAALDCPDDECKEWVGKPIHTISGNMRATDDDPLPGFGDVLPFRRNYHSLSDLSGFFGSRWSSVFNAAITRFDGLANEWVSLITETGQQYLFESTGPGTYRQRMPDGTAYDTSLTKQADGSWIQTDRDRRLVRLFNPDGKPVGFRNGTTGREVVIEWANERPVRLKDAWSGWALTVTTDPATGRVTSIAPEGEPQSGWTYTYASDRLIRVDSPLGTWRTYEYTYNAQYGKYTPLTAIRDGAGALLEAHAYSDGSRNGRSSLQDTDDITSISWLESGRIPGEQRRRVTYKSGRVDTYYSRQVGNRWRIVEIDGGCTSCSAASSVMMYDAFGNVIRSQGADGFITTNLYDTAGKNVIRAITAMRPGGCDPLTANCRLTADTIDDVDPVVTGASMITHYEYGDLNWHHRPTRITTHSVLNIADGRTETLTYDAETGEVLTRSVTGWTDSPARQETRTTVTTLYDGLAGAAFNPHGTFDSSWLELPQPRGMRKNVDGPLAGAADTTSYVYYPVDASVPALLRARLAATRNAAGHVTRYEDYDTRGNARRVIDPNGVVQTATFDALGRLVSSSTLGVSGCDTSADPLCATVLTTTRTFSVAGPLESVQAAGGGVTAYTYDDRGRIAAISRGPSMADLRERMETTYDPATGRKSVEKMLGREGSSWVEKRRTSYHYDISARVTRVTNADATTVGYDYALDGRVASMRDENHSLANTFYEYDAGGRVREVRQMLASAPDGYATTRYAYDRDGNLVSVTDPNGNVTTYLYDDFGQMLRQTSPVSGVTSYEYDGAGRLTKSTDANGAATTRTYDLLGRILTTVATRGLDSETVTWTYDTAPFGIGRVATVTEPTGSTSYAYERRGLLAREQKTIDGTTYVTAFRYDRDGNRSSMTYPSGRVVDTTYDFAGRPYSAASGSTTIVASAKYLPFGPQTEVVYGNGTTRRTSYDQRYRPLTNELSKAAGVVAQYAYTHDAAGNITAIRDQLDHGYDRTFEYDDLNRLVVANSGAALWGNGSYSYDAMGNMKSSTLGARTQSFSHSGTTPRLTGVTADGVTRSVGYDAAGNETGWGNGWAEYSPRNSMRTTDVFSYAYDGRGIRTVTELTTSATLADVLISPAAIRGGESVQGTVTLMSPAPAGGAVVRLLPSPAGLHVPPSVVVPAGSTFTTFTITTDAVTADTLVSLTATRGTTSRASLELRRSCSLREVAISSPFVTGGGEVTATLSLHDPAPAGGTAIALTSSDPATAGVPNSVTVPAGQTSITFTIATTRVSAEAEVTITAELCGTVFATLDVLPVRVEALTLEPPSVRSGSPATATVELSATAPAGGMVVETSTSDSAVAVVGSSVTVPAGAASATFQITTPRRDNQTSAVITAAESGVTATAALAVLPCTPEATPPSLPPGEIVWYDDAVPAGASVYGTWLWDTTRFASGTKSSTNAVVSGLHERYFKSTTTPMTPTDADMLFVYALIDPCNPPQAIQVAWDDGSWNRVYWGADVIGGTGRTRGGDLPPAGQWVRLEIPAARATLNNRTITGMMFQVYGGRVWFDRAGKRACDLPDAAPELEFPPDDVVWFDDAPPAGATLSGLWSWDTEVRASGTSSHVEPASTGAREHYFTTAPALTPVNGDELFVYAYIDPCNPPRQIQFEWFDGSWVHRAYWGENIVQRTGAVSMGSMPAGGSWVRLSVTASTVNLGNKPVTGMSFYVNGGKVWFDRAGMRRCVTPSGVEPPSLDPSDSVWFDEATPANATLTGSWTWDITQKAAGAQSVLVSEPMAQKKISFTGAPAMTTGVNDNLFVWALLDPCDPPREIVVEWYDGSWNHRGYWGENLISLASTGTRYMGAMPAAGEWVRLEFPARGFNLVDRNVTGMSLTVHSGKVWFDRVGKRTCTFPPPAQPALSSTEVVWFDEATPPGATKSGTWLWDAQQRASGTVSNVSPPAVGSVEYQFTGATTPLNVGLNDTLTAYVLIDPCDPPREVMLSWHESASWEHRAYWGEDIWQFAGRHSMGALPAPGQWVRLEVPASVVGVAGKSVSGLKLNVHSGKVWFDRVGLEPGTNAAATTPSWSDRLRTLGTLLTYGRMSHSALRYQSIPTASRTFTAPQSVATPRRYSLYTPELNLLAETAMTTAASPSIAYEYIWFGGQPAAQVTTSSNEVSWYFNDHLGTPVLQTDATANVVWRVEREPYGTTYATRTGADRHQPLSFPGQEEGVESEVAYNVYRWYRGGWGRYTQSDPVALAGGLNLFTYASGDPVSLIDPYGLAVVNVTVWDEKKYNTLAKYQQVNPCSVKGASYSCTERLLEDIGCICSCKGEGWGADVQINVTLRYHLAGPPPGTNTPPSFYQQKYKAHEDLHTNHLKQELVTYADSLEAQRFDSADQCNMMCGKAIGGFKQWLNNWAVASNQKFH